MAKRGPIAVACPLCLSVDDPEGMVSVAIERTNPPDAVSIALCRRCVTAIVRAAAMDDDLDPSVLFGVSGGKAESATPQDRASDQADAPKDQGNDIGTPSEDAS